MRQKTIKLNNGLDIPQIGVGTWTLRGDTARQNVCMALKAGFRHIDTAQGSMSVTYPCMLVKLAEHLSPAPQLHTASDQVELL